MKVCKLTSAEKRAYSIFYKYAENEEYTNDPEGYSLLNAERLAWEKLVKRYPHLRECKRPRLKGSEKWW